MGANLKKELAKIKLNTYESMSFQHNTMLLCFSGWADNNIVKTLSNYHTRTILPEGSGVLRKKKGDEGRREMLQSQVPCPQQHWDYSETFHFIDKGNGAEAKCDLGGQSRSHNWSPKLVMRLFNMSKNNAYKIYDALVEKYTLGRRYLDMGETVREIEHAFFQRRDSMRSQRAEHPLWLRDLSYVFGWFIGRKMRSDAQRRISGSDCQPTRAAKRLSTLYNKQKKVPWRMHQSLAYEWKGKCCWKECPNLKSGKERKRAQSYDIFMRCKECSAMYGTDMFFAMI